LKSFQKERKKERIKKHLPYCYCIEETQARAICPWLLPSPFKSIGTCLGRLTIVISVLLDLGQTPWKRFGETNAVFGDDRTRNSVSGREILAFAWQ